MIAAATTASAGSGASPAGGAAGVPGYDAWCLDGLGEPEPAGSHTSVEAALRAGAVVIHGRAVEAVRAGTPEAALDRIVRDVLRVDLRAIRCELDAAGLPRDVVTTWVRHADALGRVGDRGRTGAWLAAFARVQALEPHVTAAELRRRIASAHDHPLGDRA